VTQDKNLTDLLDVRAGQPADVILRRATLLDPVAGIDGVHDLVIRGGRIAGIAAPGEADANGAEELDAEGLHAFPAFFDPHVHLRTPGQEHKEDVETGTRAAAAGGYCGIIAMANTSPPVDTAADITALREQARAQASVPVGFTGTVTVGMNGEELTEMVELRDAGAIGFTDDGLPIRNANIMRRALQYQHLCGGQIGLAGWPSVAESTMIARDCALAAYEEARIHVQHLSAKESVEVVRAAKAAGVRISAEASPHHLVLTDEEVRSLDPRRFKMNPPLRHESDRQALIDALRDGTIECIATDHAPHHADEKEVPFEQAAFGVTGLETAFAALHTELVLPGVIDLGLLIERMAGGAAPFDVPRPTLAVGSEANVALCDLAAEWTVGEDGYESRSSNSWAEGRTLTGRVLVTVAAGQVAFRLRSFSLGVAS
jgi:dihydroorotase